MLIEFRVANHRSIREEQVLSMEAGRVGDASDPRPRQVPGYKDKLLTVAALYGANASGKSNLLSALAFMRDAVVSSHRFWPPDNIVPREPFAWDDFRSNPSLFEVVLVLEGTRYEYGFVVTDSRISEEWLYAWPKSKKQTWFERDESNFKFGDQLKGELKLVESVTRPNALFLSTAVQHDNSQLQNIFHWFSRIAVEGLSPGSQQFRFQANTFELFPEFQIEEYLKDRCDEIERTASRRTAYSRERVLKLMSLLQNADLGIIDLKSDSHSEPWDEVYTGSRVYYLRHASQTSEEKWLPLSHESNGTRNLFLMAASILKTVETGGTLVIDELERSLHPALAQKIVELFNNPKSNPNNAQLIFTTHDTNLLGNTVGEPALRRDQVWLTEKDKTGATVIYPLTDFKPRKAENLERGYLQGRYGAVPFLSWMLTEGAT